MLQADPLTVDADGNLAWGNGTIYSGDYSTAWGNGTIYSGNYSTAWGYGIADGDYSTAWGFFSMASGHYSTAWGGHDTWAGGDYSTAWGSEAYAIGDYSTAWGYRVHANSYLSTAFGAYNIASPHSGLGLTSWIPEDPLLEIGIGLDSDSRANALTILKDGRIALGTHISFADLQAQLETLLVKGPLVVEDYVGGVNASGQPLDADDNPVAPTPGTIRYDGDFWGYDASSDWVSLTAGGFGSSASTFVNSSGLPLLYVDGNDTIVGDPSTRFVLGADATPGATMSISRPSVETIGGIASPNWDQAQIKLFSPDWNHTLALDPNQIVANINGPLEIWNAHSNGTMRFLTGGRQSSVVFIDKNGKLGVGTTSPNQKLQVNGAISIGSTSTSIPGTIRYNGTDFQGFNGAWVSLTSNDFSTFSTALVDSTGDPAVYFDAQDKLIVESETNVQDKLSVNAPYIPSFRETIFDASLASYPGFIKIGNLTKQNAFVPVIAGTSGVGGNADIWFWGLRQADDDVWKPNAAAFTFDAQNYAGSDAMNADTYGPVLNRDLFMVKNAATKVMVIAASGNMGVGVAAPAEKLHIDGAIALGDTTTNTEGAIRYDGTDFEGYKDGGWVSLTSGGTGPAGSASTLVDGSNHPIVEVSTDGSEVTITPAGDTAPAMTFSSGGVVTLATAQGDISMGAFGMPAPN